VIPEEVLPRQGPHELASLASLAGKGSDQQRLVWAKIEDMAVEGSNPWEISGLSQRRHSMLDGSAKPRRKPPYEL
jgi:hypothetical protein